MKNGNFIKIQDGIIIKRESLKGYHKDKYDSKACHYYVALYDSKTKTYSMYPTSHYVDPKKATDIKRNRAILMRIKGAPGVSTVYRQPRKKDVNGQPFTDKFNRYEKVGLLSNYQQNRLKDFIFKFSQKTKKKP